MPKLTLLLVALLAMLAAPVRAQLVGLDPAGADALACYRAHQTHAQRTAPVSMLIGAGIVFRPDLLGRRDN